MNYVAKRFHKTSDNADSSVSVADNALLLEQDYRRLKQGTWFLNAFYAEAHKRGVDVAEGTSPKFAALQINSS